MAITRERRIEFLKQRQLFMELEEEEVNKIARRLEEYTLPAGEVLFAHGDRGSVFYLIYKGKIRVWRKKDDQEIDLAALESGDTFGEEALLYNRPRSATISALDETHLFTMERSDFNWMIKTYPEILTSLEALAQAHQMHRRQRFPWLNEQEDVYRVTRRHWADLIFDLLKPGAVILLSLIFLLLTALIPGLRTVSNILGGLLAISGVLWFIWEILDWTNDYFIITNQRVIWLEEIFLQSNSRQEAPMAAIQSVNLETSQIGRIFGYGNVYVRTFTGTGSLLLTRVNQPHQFRDLIEELLIRVRQRTEEAQEGRMRQSIRQSLGLESEPIEPIVQMPELDDSTRGFIGFLKTREIKGDEVTYHRHWWVLFVKTWLPLLGVAAIIILTIYLASQNLTIGAIQLPVLSTFLLLLLGFGTFGGILGYRYLDWKNDIYRITKEMIIDSERKPFGSEITKSAPIKNILSLEHARKGILRLLLNFGNVNIVVADMVFTFIDVHDPAQVQQDIFYRQEQLKLEAEESEALQERERMGEWLRAYHEVWQEEKDQLTGDSDSSEDAS